MGRITEAVKHLILLNILLFIAPKLVGFDLQNMFALHFPLNPQFGFWQIITHMFMHSQQTFMHILFNMYALWAFGTPLEQMWGRNKFLFFYFSAGLGAAAIYTLANYYQYHSIYEDLTNIGVSTSDIQKLITKGQYDSRILEYISEGELSKIYNAYNSSAVGASGAIYGILVAFGFAFPNAKLALIFFPVPIAAKYFIPLIILGDLFFGLTGYSIGSGPNVAHWAHVGGALIGFLIVWYWKQNQFKRWN
jgi:membrane associated rhomboid family serine protease